MQQHVSCDRDVFGRDQMGYFWQRGLYLFFFACCSQEIEIVKNLEQLQGKYFIVSKHIGYLPFCWTAYEEGIYIFVKYQGREMFKSRFEKKKLKKSKGYIYVRWDLRRVFIGAVPQSSIDSGDYIV